MASTIYIAGLGNVFIPDDSIDRITDSATNPLHPTKAGDMYAFGVLAFEVRIEPLNGSLSTFRSETDPHRTSPLLWNDRNSGNVLDAEGR